MGGSSCETRRPVIFSIADEDDDVLSTFFRNSSGRSFPQSCPLARNSLVLLRMQKESTDTYSSSTSKLVTSIAAIGDLLLIASVAVLAQEKAKTETIHATAVGQMRASGKTSSAAEL